VLYTLTQMERFELSPVILEITILPLNYIL
jgi:hypothetical protein